MTLQDVVAAERMESDGFIEDGAGAGEHRVPRPEETLTAQIHNRQITILKIHQRTKVLDSVIWGGDVDRGG